MTRPSWRCRRSARPIAAIKDAGLRQARRIHRRRRDRATASSTSAPPTRWPAASTAPTLSADDQLSYDLLLYRNAALGEHLPLSPQRLCVRPDERRAGRHPGLPDQHPQGRERADARDYISRIRATGTYIDQAVAEAQEREKLGVLPPKWVFPQVIEQSKNLITGAPFDHGPDNDVFADFKAKVGKLTIPQATKDALIAEAQRGADRVDGPGLPAADRAAAATSRSAPAPTTASGASPTARRSIRRCSNSTPPPT